jgi:hypothetical protein
MELDRQTRYGDDRGEQLSAKYTSSIFAWKGLSSYPLVERWKWIVFPISLFIFTRIALLGFSYISLTLNPDLRFTFSPGQMEERFRRYGVMEEATFLRQYPVVDGLCRWDCEWFFLIARIGYWEAKATNFFPLYPLLARVVHDVTGMHLRFALLLVSNVAALGALLVIYRVFLLLTEEDAARSALTLFMAFPFAFFQATGYPESLMVFSTALAILLALRGNHIWAGVALGFGVLARHLTMFAGAALLAAQIKQRGLRPKRFLLSPAIIGLLMPWLFLALYSFYQYREFGDPLTFWAARDGWGEYAWWGILDLIGADVQDDLWSPPMYMYPPFALIPTIGAIVLAAKKQWIELASFAIIFMVMLWAVGIWGIGRYSASCWPAFLPLGVWLAKHPNLQGPVIVMLALFQGLFFYLFSHQYPIL